MNDLKNMQSKKVFIVEDNEWYAKMLEHIVCLNPDYEVIIYHTGEECLKNLHLKPMAITLDFRLPDMEGSEVLKKIKNYNAEIEVIVISEQDDIETAIDLLKNGAYDYLVKGNDIKNRLFNTLAKIQKNYSLQTEIETLKQEVELKYDFKSMLIGESKEMQDIFRLMEKSLNNDINVSITGETGTGKELVAKAIHYNSNRKKGNFVAVNVAAVPKELIESEFFGHEKGAFTGANARRIGKFEEADGGTLFLDEIGDMDLNFQTKLLRVLQEQEVVRVGSNKPVKVNPRIIVATHKNLKELVEKGQFREDLYYRLIGLSVKLPPLRERGNDVLVMAIVFMSDFCKKNKISKLSFSKEAKRALLAYDFPGNVRELKAMIELACVMSSGNEISEDDLNIEKKSLLDFRDNKNNLTMRQYEMLILKDYLNKYNNNVKEVADKLDIGVATVYRMLKQEQSIFKMNGNNND